MQGALDGVGSGKTINSPHERSHFVGCGDGSARFGDAVGDGSLEVGGGVTLGAGCGNGIAEKQRTDTRTRWAVSMAPRASMRRNTVSSSGALTSAMGRSPKKGKIFFSSRSITSSEWRLLHAGSCFSYHSRATCSKVMGSAACCSSFLTSPGSIPPSSCLRASAARSRLP